MVTTYIPDRGDIINLDFDPSSGHEIQGRRFALVLTPKSYNRQMGLLYACPITGGAVGVSRSAGMNATLIGAGTDTQGKIVCSQMKALDWKARKASFKEKVPEFVVEDVLARIHAVLFD
ncbi:type II toxin-antitoxin system PemK/MazF family toxin [Neisseria leonii]|uniref:Type II toxin-antitoxin system PemK/MazF family toxin n=1 Tax=Neisseria leonii TaxID=2995413 RepID=A0A9X4E2G0_9NEIS|nr:type II toxin-antitoxin system PemK/MazF family toxin [Neisseria sp. 51.81]MDD9326731.1 type II toxin-antitoxin system PemK/MazF family toxin [Neisseria sp. 51.81]